MENQTQVQYHPSFFVFNDRHFLDLSLAAIGNTLQQLSAKDVRCSNALTATVPPQRKAVPPTTLPAAPPAAVAIARCYNKVTTEQVYLEVNGGTPTQQQQHATAPLYLSGLTSVQDHQGHESYIVSKLVIFIFFIVILGRGCTIVFNFTKILSTIHGVFKRLVYSYDGYFLFVFSIHSRSFFFSDYIFVASLSILSILYTPFTHTHIHRYTHTSQRTNISRSLFSLSLSLSHHESMLPVQDHHILSHI